MRDFRFGPEAGFSAALVALVMSVAPTLAAQAEEGAILAAVEQVYAGISANEGESRDWRAFNDMFLPEARLVNPWIRDGETIVRSWSVPEWIVVSGLRLEGRGFVEDFVHSEVRQYGPIAHVLTTWVTRSERGGQQNSRGAATLQLVKTDEGWRVASWIWASEVDGMPLPGQ